MIHLSTTRVLLAIGALLGFLSILFESIAIDNDVKWNSWLSGKVKNGLPPSSLKARATPAQIISVLYRASWYEPLALSFITLSFLVEVATFVLVQLRKIPEDSIQLRLHVAVQTSLNLIAAVFILQSLLNYETGYGYLVQATFKDKQKYGPYPELGHCQIHPAYAPKGKAVKHACQYATLKILTVIFCVFNVILQCAVLVVSTLLYLEINAVYPDEIDYDEYDGEEEEVEVEKAGEIVESQEQEEEAVTITILQPEDPLMGEQTARSSGVRSSGGSNQMELVT